MWPGHYLYPLLQSAAALEPSQELEAAVRKLHADHAAHAADSLIEALDAGSFTKVSALALLLLQQNPGLAAWGRLDLWILQRTGLCAQ